MIRQIGNFVFFETNNNLLVFEIKDFSYEGKNPDNDRIIVQKYFGPKKDLKDFKASSFHIPVFQLFPRIRGRIRSSSRVPEGRKGGADLRHRRSGEPWLRVFRLAGGLRSSGSPRGW